VGRLSPPASPLLPSAGWCCAGSGAAKALQSRYEKVSYRRGPAGQLPVRGWDNACFDPVPRCVISATWLRCYRHLGVPPELESATVAHVGEASLFRRLVVDLEVAAHYLETLAALSSDQQSKRQRNHQ